VLWDPEADLGYQMTGEVNGVQEKAAANGHAPGFDEAASTPKVEKELLVHVENVLLFSHALHRDRVLKGDE